MIQDTDENILNNDFLKWTTSIKQSFRYQLKDNIRKRIITMLTTIGKPSTIFPFTTILYVRYRVEISRELIPLAIPIKVFVVSDDTETTEYCINSAFDILLDKIRNGFSVVDSSPRTRDYRYFSPMTSAPSTATDKNTSSIFYTYNTKNMKSNLFKDTYETLQGVSLL